MNELMDCCASCSAILYCSCVLYQMFIWYRRLSAVKFSEVNSYITTSREVKKTSNPLQYLSVVCMQPVGFTPNCKINVQAVLLKRGPVCSRVRSEGEGRLASEGIHATQNNPSSWLPNN